MLVNRKSNEVTYAAGAQRVNSTSASRACVSLLIFLSFAGIMHAGNVNCTNGSGDAATLSGQISLGGTVTVSGTCSVRSAISINNAVIISGVNGAKLVAAQNQIFQINTNSVSITGLTFDGGWVAFGGAVTYSNFTFTNNTVQNITSGSKYGGPVALSGPGLINANITGNTFQNLWGGGGFPAAPDDSNADGTWGSYGISFKGLDRTAISRNTFDRIGGDAIYASWANFTGFSTPHYTTTGNVISDNVFTRVHRIPIEIQSQPSSCPGGCDYAITNTTGLQVKGNYTHDPAFPFYNTWGYSLVPSGNLKGQFINNTGTANIVGSGYYAAFMEVATGNGVVQGNVGASVPGSSPFYGAGFPQERGLDQTFTTTYQNNVLCGNAQTGRIFYEQAQASSARIVDQYNYKNAGSCPAGTSLTASKITVGYTTGNNQSFPNGGSGTWNLYVVSNLSIRNVRFLLDNSTTPVATQELQDVNSNFVNDLRWLYHVTLNTSALTAGSHTLTALATDVSGNTKSVASTFTVGNVAPIIPQLSVSPTALSFGSITVATSTSAQSVYLKSTGTAPVAVQGITLGGTNAADFSQTSNCGSSLAVGASCTIQIKFTPLVAGSRTAAVGISHNATGSANSISLSGTGVSAAPPPPPPPPAGGSLPTNLPQGMILWLANNAGIVASGNKVSAWDDQSGAGNHSVQPNAANQPLLVPANNGQNALRFNGSASFLSLPSLPIDGSTGVSIFVVSSSASDPAAGYASYALLYWPETTAWGSSFFGSYRTTAHFRFGTTQVGNELCYNMPFTRTNSFGLSEWVHSGTSDTMWFNGQSVFSSGSKLQQINGIGGSALLGQGMNKTFYAGDISEVIVYSRALSAAERQTLETYLMAKYHL